MNNFSICPLASSSKGNSYLISGGSTHILLDCGISYKTLNQALSSFNLTASDISGIVITHEHTDHTKGLSSCLKKAHVPVYTSLKTWQVIYKSIGEFEDSLIKVVEKGVRFKIGNIEICAFGINHDAADPLGYCFYYEDKKISAVTDSGIIGEDILEYVKGSNLSLIEANHDINMLDMGNYPFLLKQRIKGPKGHLSNEDAADFSLFLAEHQTKTVLLGHLSQENNYPHLALLTIEEKLKSSLENLPFPEIYVVPPKFENKIFIIK